MNLGRQGRSGENRCQQGIQQILTTHKSAPEDRANSVRARLLRTLTVTACVRRFGRRIVRRFVVLKDTRNFAKKSFFLFVGILGGCGSRGPGGPGLSSGWRRRKGLIPS